MSKINIFTYFKIKINDISLRSSKNQSFVILAQKVNLPMNRLFMLTPKNTHTKCNSSHKSSVFGFKRIHKKGFPDQKFSCESSSTTFDHSHYSKSQIFVQKFNFDKTPTFSQVFHPNFFENFSREIKVVNS